MASLLLSLISAYILVVGCQTVSRLKPYYDSLFVDKLFSCGGPTRNISQNQIYRVEFSEEEPPADQCSLTFKTETMSNCSGSCYMFVPNAFIKRSGINFTVSSGAQSQVFTYENRVPIGPRCSTETQLSLTFIRLQNYKFSLKARSFHITMELYNKCGERGAVKSITFDEAIKHVDGYETDGERQAKERTTYITGILLGFGLSCFFLIIFCFSFAHGRLYDKRLNTTVDARNNADGSKQKHKISENKRKHLEIETTRKPENKPLLEMVTVGHEKSPTEAMPAVKFSVGDIERDKLQDIAAQ